MADVVNIKYLYPPNMLDGDWDEHSGNKRVIVQLIGLSDGTGEADVIKIALSDLKTLSGAAPKKTAVEWIEYDILGITVSLEWDRAPHAPIALLNASATITQGKKDWTQISGNVDPGGDDRTGNILLTTTNADSGDSYDITICLRLKD